MSGPNSRHNAHEFNIANLYNCAFTILTSIACLGQKICESKTATKKQDWILVVAAHML